MKIDQNTAPREGKKKFSILTEEQGFIENEDKRNIWIIDPIDGTTNFLHGVPHFCISIALRSSDEITSGIIFDPINPHPPVINIEFII